MLDKLGEQEEKISAAVKRMAALEKSTAETLQNRKQLYFSPDNEDNKAAKNTAKNTKGGKATIMILLNKTIRLDSPDEHDQGNCFQSFGFLVKQLRENHR